VKLAEAVLKATEQPIDFKFLYDLQVFYVIYVSIAIYYQVIFDETEIKSSGIFIRSCQLRKK
jgi:hypothetical protein